MMQEALTDHELIQRIPLLTGDERIMISIPEDYSRQLRFAYYKRQGLENLLMSYLNRTTEHADAMNLEKFTDRVAITYMDEAATIREVGMTILGTDVYEYLSSTITPQVFSIDFERSILIIHPTNATNPTLYVQSCNCGSSACKINHN